MKGRRSTRGHVVAAAVAPWLIRWVLLRDFYQKIPPPGTEKRKWIHVVCPEDGCTSSDWVRKVEPGTVSQCGQHGPRILMVRCNMCQHPVPKDLP